MARDHRKKILALSILDICPTLDMYENKYEICERIFPLVLLIQPTPLPEKMIIANPKIG